MLMSPNQQGKPTLPSGPGGTLDPEYNFIFNDKKKSRLHLSFHLPGGSKFTKTIILVVGGGIILMVLIIISSSLLSSKGVNSKQLVDVMARAKEISRVSTLITQQPTGVDANTLNLAATASSSLSSEQVQLATYLHQSHVKVGAKDLSHYLNKNTDTQLQSATQSGSLNATYYSYLKTHLTDYQNTLQTIYQASPPKAKPILQDANASAKTILAAPQIASAQ